MAHFITGLQTGGAETMLVSLLRAADRTRWQPLVVSLRDRGTLATEIEALDIPVTAVGLGTRWPSPGAAWRVRSALKHHDASLFMGWMYHGNIGALIARAALGGPMPVVWGIQYTPDDLDREKPATALLIRWGARLSTRAARIVYNSRVSAARHEQLGYDPSRARVIPNGVDMEQFAPSDLARAAWRARLGVSPDTVVIGRIARYHAMKDFPGFLTAAAQLLRERPGVRFVMAGRGVDAANRELMNHVAQLGLHEHVSLLGEVRPPNELTAALDIACSPSAYGEGFPGVLVEAMACGVPCVTTEVGDSGWIVGPTGVVIPPRDPRALVAALRSLVDAGADGRRELGRQALARVREHFGIASVTAQYEALYAEVLS